MQSNERAEYGDHNTCTPCFKLVVAASSDLSSVPQRFDVRTVKTSFETLKFVLRMRDNVSRTEEKKKLQNFCSFFFLFIFYQRLVFSLQMAAVVGQQLQFYSYLTTSNDYPQGKSVTAGFIHFAHTTICAAEVTTYILFVRKHFCGCLIARPLPVREARLPLAGNACQFNRR